MTTWADIRAGDIVRLKGDDWTVTAAERRDLISTLPAKIAVTIERMGRTVGPRGMDPSAEVERVDPKLITDVHTVGEIARAKAGDLPAAEALATVQLGAVVVGRRDGAQPWQVVGVDETMIHTHLYNFHGIDVVAVGSAAEAMALHLADHAAAVKAGSFVEHEHVA